jgi:hypothetical protein
MTPQMIGSFANFHDRQHTVAAHVTEDDCAMVLVKTESGGSVLDLASGNARALAKLLLEAADRAERLPGGSIAVETVTVIEDTVPTSWRVWPYFVGSGANIRIAGYQYERLAGGQHHTGATKVHSASESQVKVVIDRMVGRPGRRPMPVAQEITGMFQTAGFDAVYEG